MNEILGNPFADECTRKEKLLDLFDALEQLERKTKAKLKGPKKKYERIIKGWARVTKIRPSSLVLRRENGELIRPLMINPEISALIHLHDDLMLAAGLRDGQWHMIFLGGIASHLSEDHRPARPIPTPISDKVH